MTVQHRMRKGERRAVILSAGVKVARKEGLRNVTHERVATACAWPTSVATVWRLMGHTRNLTRRIVEYARVQGYRDVIAQADDMGI